MKYLFKTARTLEEKEQLSHYIQQVERNFKGTFVHLDEAKELIKKVEDAFARKLRQRWK